MKNMLNVENKWIGHWRSIDEKRCRIWQFNMAFFLKATEPLMTYCDKDIVLDIGCGLGYLADVLKRRVKEVHCLDISKRFLDVARKRFAQYRNVFFYELDSNNYTDLSFMRDKRFSKIICQSVVQYYKDYFEVERLIEGVRRIASPGARFLISDMPTDNGPFRDMLSILKFGFMEKCLLEVIKHVTNLRFSNYYRVRDGIGVLVFSRNILNKIIEKNKLNAEILTTQLTTNKSRVHLLIKF